MFEHEKQNNWSNKKYKNNGNYFEINLNCANKSYLTHNWFDTQFYFNKKQTVAIIVWKKRERETERKKTCNNIENNCKTFKQEIELTKHISPNIDLLFHVILLITLILFIIFLHIIYLLCFALYFVHFMINVSHLLYLLNNRNCLSCD